MVKRVPADIADIVYSGPVRGYAHKPLLPGSMSVIAFYEKVIKVKADVAAFLS